MVITKYTHSCLLVQSANRTVLFDPGVYSTFAVNELPDIHDVCITHLHSDHMDMGLLRQIRARFPRVRITAPPDAVSLLASKGITNVQSVPPNGLRLFTSPHETIRPYADADAPQEYGYHFEGVLSHPGDSHSFDETMAGLALPVQAPWGSVVEAMRIALALKPEYVFPVHDWHWSIAARQQLYEQMHGEFAKHGIVFVVLIDGKPVDINIEK